MGAKKIGLIFLLVLVGAAIITILKFREKEPEVEITPLVNSWEMAVPLQKIPEGLASLSASQCGVCHKAHYEEWKTSTHANAWVDEQFQAELKKETSPYLCINCHIPLQNQQEFMVDGLRGGDVYKPVQRKNHFWDQELQQEGITCAACHVRNDAIVGPTGAPDAPHKTVKDPDFLSESLCISCHNAVAVVTPVLACSFETGDEWKAGPYPGKKNCISCHMEETERSLVEGYPLKKSHFHRFTGSGIPKHDTLSVQMLKSLEFDLESVSRVKAGESKVFRLKVKNAHAGHRVPTGDPERFILIHFAVQSADGKTVKEETFRIGETWKWYPKAQKVTDNNLNPLEERLFEFKPGVLKKGKYRLSVTATKFRTTAETAKYNNLSSHYPISAEMYSQEMSFYAE